MATLTAAATLLLYIPRSAAQEAPAAPPPPAEEAAPPPAEPTGKPSLVVVGIVPPSFETRIDPATGRRLTMDLERELSSSPALTVFPQRQVADALTDVDPAADAAKELTHIGKEVRRGRKLLDDLKLEDAIAAFSAAIEGYKKNLVFMKNYQPLVDTLLQLGVAYFRIGEDEKGQAYLTQVLCLQPTLELKEGEYPEIFTRIFGEVRTRVLEGPKGSINVASSPPFSEIWLNGEKKGVTPLLIRDLIKGRYFIRVEKKGYKPYNAEIEVGDKAGELVQVSLEPEPRVIKYNKKQVFGELTELAAKQDWGAEFRKKAGLVAGWLGVQFVLVGLVVRGDEYEMTAFLYRASDGGLMALPTTIMDNGLLNAAIEIYKLAEVAGEKVTFFPDTPPSLPRIKPLQVTPGMITEVPPDDPSVSGPIGPGPGPTPGPGTGPAVEQEWYEKWWVWTLVVVGAAAVAGAGVGIYFATKPEADPTATVSWPK